MTRHIPTSGASARAAWPHGSLPRVYARLILILS